MALSLEPTAETRSTDVAEASAESPFLDGQEAGWVSAPVPAAESPFLPETPFLSEYSVGEDLIRPEEPALRELLEDLYDSEFDEALADLAAEAETYVAALGLGESEGDQARAERMLETWIEPLRQEAQSMLSGLAEAFEAEDPAAMSEDRFEAIFNRFEPRNTEHGPVFEDFLKKFLKKAKSIAKGAIKAAKKGIAAVSKIMPIGIILRKLAVLARPLLTKVLKFALNKLPAEYRDPAKLLARRFLGINVAEMLDEFEDEELSEEEWEAEEARDAGEQPATADIRTLQEAFDAEAASLVFAPSEQEQDLYLAEALFEGAASVPSSLSELDAARQQFVDGMARLGEGEDPTPLVENFLPAILPALKLGLKLVGRPRVVRFLAGYLGRLIAPYVGPSVSPGLSRAIVDAGLRVISLEAEAEADRGAGETPMLAAEAFASLVEDTVARVSQLDEEDLADESLVEEAAYTAFHESAASTFPSAVLSPQSEYLETGRAGGAWVPMPRSGPRRYRKYSRVFNVVIHPAAARAIRTFAGRPLSAFIGDRLGRTGPIRARIHLYQAVPGSSLARIARSESGVAGLGSADRNARSRLHPLTPMAAAALVGEPGLGREVSEDYADGTGPLAIGQRLFYLEVAGNAAPAATGSSVPGGDGGDAGDDGGAAGGDAGATDGGASPGAGATDATGAAPSPTGAAATAPSAPTTPGAVPQSSDATAVIKPAGGVVTVTIYASEAEAQALAARLRRREPIGASLAILRRIYGRAIGTALGGGPGRVRFRSEGEDEVDAMSESEGDEVGMDELVRGGFGRAPTRRFAVRRPLFRRRRAWRRGFGWRRRPRRFRRRLLVAWIARALAAELVRSRDNFLQAVDAPADGVTFVITMRPPGLRPLLARGAAPGVPIGGPGPAQVRIHPGRRSG